MKVFQSAEQTGNIITMFATDGSQVSALQIDLESFIEENELNYRNEGNGLMCDPYSDSESVKFCTEAEYLDNNFDEVCELYFRELEIAA